IAFFSSADTPVSVALAVDTSSSMRSKIGEVVAATSAFARSSNPDDELFVVEFNDRVRDALAAHQFIRAADVHALANAVSALNPDGRTALYDGIDGALDRVEAGTRPRKLVIVISDGGDNASVARLDQVLARARHSDVAIYTVGVFAEDDLDRNPGVLK